MASQGPNGPSAATTSNANGGVNDWTTPANAEAADSVYTTSGGSAGDTYLLKVSNFGFSIPAGATIDGVLVEVLKATNGIPGVLDATVQLLALTATGDDKADTGTNWTTLPGYISYGGSADGWSASLTVSKVNDVKFGVQIAATTSGAPQQPKIDYIRITVYYTDAPDTLIGQACL